MLNRVDVHLDKKGAYSDPRKTQVQKTRQPHEECQEQNVNMYMVFFKLWLKQVVEYVKSTPRMTPTRFIAEVRQFQDSTQTRV